MTDVDWWEESQEWIAAQPDYPPRPTEVTVPVFEHVGPTYRPGEGGGWYAALVAHPNPDGEHLAHCEHLHESPDRAWACAAVLSRDLAQQVIDGRNAD